jgi:hypothetical protein
MAFRKIGIMVAALVVLPLGLAFGTGAGGLTWGEQYFDSTFSNYDLQARYSGVYGYSVTRGGQRIGGFAIGIDPNDQAADVHGGFIGAITGQEMRTGAFSAALNIWTGLGGLSVNPVLRTGGGFALFGEADLELGVSFMKGFQVVVYGGMQGLADVATGRLDWSAIYYTPVFGVRVAWGSF